MVAVVLMLGLLAGGGWVLFGRSSSSSARTVLDRSLAKARAVGSFHYVSVSNGTNGTFTTIGDAGRNSGKQEITTSDSSGTASFTVLVVGSACYFRGDSLAMRENLGVDAAVAQAHAQQWISLSPSDAPYASVYAAVDTHDALSDNITFKPQQLGSTTVGGRKLQTVSGAIEPVTGQTKPVTGTATLEVSAASNLPVRYTERGTSDGQSMSVSMTFSGFGEKVSESAPPGALAFSSLGGTGGGSSSTSPPVFTSVRF
ncbi:MAG: hypothetical protein ABSH04_04980 [Acidimicrobiales bacterium]